MLQNDDIIKLKLLTNILMKSYQHVHLISAEKVAERDNCSCSKTRCPVA